MLSKDIGHWELFIHSSVVIVPVLVLRDRVTVTTIAEMRALPPALAPAGQTGIRPNTTESGNRHLRGSKLHPAHEQGRPKTL